MTNMGEKAGAKFQEDLSFIGSHASTSLSRLKSFLLLRSYTYVSGLCNKAKAFDQIVSLHLQDQYQCLEDQ